MEKRTYQWRPRHVGIVSDTSLIDSNQSAGRDHETAASPSRSSASSDLENGQENKVKKENPRDGQEDLERKMEDKTLERHLRLLMRLPEKDELEEILSSPLFTYPVLKHAEGLASGSSKTPFPQFALLAGDAELLQHKKSEDPRLFYNVAAPSSAFICGSQGSGKSHTLSCMLESCLIPSSKLGRLPKPLTGIMFHYDTFISDSGGAPCEAAYLATDPRIKIRVLCPPTNISIIKDTYSILKNVTVEELRLNESDLNTKRMLDLMAFGDRSQPLYMQVIQRILRDMRIAQQSTGSGFQYAKFVKLIVEEGLTPDQMRPLNQRLDTLESFLVPGQVHSETQFSNAKSSGTDWTPRAGELIIVDLSCPCVTAAMACSLFNICLSIFLEQDSSCGRFIALDEAHKYMSETAECEGLTNNLLSAIRLQRHLGARIFISTQEPTISPKLLDLCSITIVHRFTSPDWLKVLTQHLAGISVASKVARMLDNTEQINDKKSVDGPSGLHGVITSSDDPILELFSRIVQLKTGEALFFASSAIVGLESEISVEGEARITHKRLAHRVMRVMVRARITADGGQSIMAA